MFKLEHIMHILAKSFFRSNLGKNMVEGGQKQIFSYLDPLRKLNKIQFFLPCPIVPYHLVGDKVGRLDVGHCSPTIVLRLGLIMDY